eukprot:gene7154-biopygen4160
MRDAADRVLNLIERRTEAEQRDVTDTLRVAPLCSPPLLPSLSVPRRSEEFDLVRLTVTRLRDDDEAAVQLACLQLIGQDAKPLIITTASNRGGDNAGHRTGPAAAARPPATTGQRRAQWVDYQRAPLVFRLGAPNSTTVRIQGCKEMLAP